MDRGTAVRNDLLEFIKELMHMLGNVGMTIPQTICPLVNKETRTTEEALTEAMARAQREYGEPPDVILYLLPSKGIQHTICISAISKDLLLSVTDPYSYQEVKRVAERDLGVVTQCFVATSAGIGMLDGVSTRLHRLPSTCRMPSTWSCSVSCESSDENKS